MRQAIRTFFTNILIFSVLLACVLCAAAQTASRSVQHRESVEFIENKGQWDGRALFRAGLSGGRVFLEKNAFTYSFLSAEDLKKIHDAGHARDKDARKAVRQMPVRGHAIRVHFAGANSDARISGEQKQSSYRNFYMGKDPSRWATGVPVYASVRYRGLYPSSDLIVYSENGSLKYDFVVGREGDPKRIRLYYEGADKIEVKDGNLLVTTSVNTITEMQPFAWQGSKEHQVPCHYMLEGSTVTFEFPEGYNRKLPLIIDPALVFSTYSGSVESNWGHAAAFDSYGNMYSSGISFGTGYPVTAGAYQTNFAGSWQDIAFSKYSQDGSTLLYATYLGGDDDDYPISLIVNNNDELVLLGNTWSPDYPVTPSAFDTTSNAWTDITISRFNPDGTALLASTYVGGAGGDNGVNYYLEYNYGDVYRGDIIVDASDNVYVASTTTSTSFPVTAGAYQTLMSNDSWSQEACVFKMDPSLSTLIWGTFLGGGLDDAAYSVRLDTAGNVVVAGGTASTNFPVTPGALQTVFLGGSFWYDFDGFVSVLSSDGSSLLASTYMGTPGYDQVYFADVGEDNSIFLLGQTDTLFTVTPGVYSHNDGAAFIIKLTPGLDSVYYSATYGAPLTGFADDLSPTGFLVDVCERVYFTAWGPTTGLPVSPDAYQSATDGYDFYLLNVDKDASALIYATYFGGGSWEHVDGGTSRFDNNGIVYQTVCTDSWDFPVNPGAYATANQNGSWDICAYKFDFQPSIMQAIFNINPSDSGCIPFTVDFTNTSVGGTSYFWDFGNGDSSTLQNPVYTFNAPGNYNVELTIVDSNSCEIIDTFVLPIAVSVAPLADFSFDTLVGINEEVLFMNLSQNASDFVWDFGDGATSTEVDPSHAYSATGLYTVCLLASNGTWCGPDSLCKTVEVVLPMLDAPSAFTPNGDGKNDRFYIFGEGLETMELKIFNRWGEKIFESTDATTDTNGWDGAYKGEPQPAGTYVYHATGRSVLGDDFFKKGNITLIR